MSDFPGEGTLEEATERMNALIEKYVREDPPQYYWVHRRFKTRPEGQPGIY
jgi:KDO2-lipid IV(A) lauroyltransferase